MILQNFVPHERYHGAEPAEIADHAQRDGARGEPAPMPDWGSDVTLEEMRILLRECRRLMPADGLQIPPNPADWWLPLVETGATDLGGCRPTGTTVA